MWADTSQPYYPQRKRSFWQDKVTPCRLITGEASAPKALSPSPSLSTSSKGPAWLVTVRSCLHCPPRHSWDSSPDLSGSSVTSSGWKQQQAQSLFISPASLGQAPSSFHLPASVSVGATNGISHSVLAQTPNSHAQDLKPTANHGPRHTCAAQSAWARLTTKAPLHQEFTSRQPSLVSWTLNGVAVLPPWALTRRSSGQR